MKLIHFCAMIQLEEGKIEYFDGMFTTDNRMEYVEWYKSLKRFIGRTAG